MSYLEKLQAIAHCLLCRVTTTFYHSTAELKLMAITFAGNWQPELRKSQAAIIVVFIEDT